MTAGLILMHDFSAERFLGESSAVLLLLGATILMYRTFRGRYLAAWLLGWLAYLVYKFAGSMALTHRGWMALSGGAYMLALAMFAAAILYYTNHRKRLLPLALFTALAVDVAVVRALWFESSAFWSMATVVLAGTLRCATAAHLAVFNWGRRRVGPWLLAASLVLLHMHDPLAQDVVTAYDAFVELLLGLSMAVIVLDDSQERSHRLRLLSGLTSAIAESETAGPMIEAVLRELKTLSGAKAAWYRALDGDHLVLQQHVGISAEYAANRHSLNVGTAFSGLLLRQGATGVIRAHSTDPATRHRLEKEGFDHVVVIPVVGQRSTLGTVALGMGHRYNYTADELQFFSAAAKQVGMAIENQRLVGQILHSQKQWVATFDSIEDWVLVHDDRFRIIKVNRTLLERLGKPPGDVVNNTCEAALPRLGESWQAWQGCPYCWRDVTSFGEAPDPCFGGFSQVSSSSYAEEGSRSLGTVHIIKDITDRLAAEERYRRFFEQVHEGVFVSTPEGRLLNCNDAFARMLGYSREEVLALDIAQQLYGEPAHREEFRRRMERDGLVRNYEVELRTKDGSMLAALETSFATRDPEGRIVNYQGFLLDVTEKKRAEDEIRRRNRELHALNLIATTANQSLELDDVLRVALEQVVELFAADTGAVYIVDEEHRMLRRRVGFGHRSPLGTAMPDVRIPEEFWDRMRQARTEVITRRHLEQLPPVVADFVAGEGLRSWIWVLLWSKDKIVGVLGISSRTERVFSETDESLLVAIGRQLATTMDKVRLYQETRRAYEDLSRTQEQLLQSEKMSAVGQLISGVTHELNNPLTAILGYAQLLEGENIGERARDFARKIYKQAQRTHKIVQSLLSFSRQRKPAKQPVDLRGVLEETLALRDYDLKLNNIEVRCEFEPALPEVTGDPHQLEQVFLNMINNAVDAILEKGRSGVLRVRGFLEEGRVCVELHDSGPGIRDPKRIFDPFYTTKSVGKGTGLGLSICYGIIKEHGGEIVACNHPEGGAVLRVYLPPDEERSASGGPGESEAAAPPALHGRILIVDDEEAVLDFEREVLTAAGAEVVAVSGGEQAIACLASETFDAVILDSKLPGRWSGMELYRWIAKNRPEQCPHMAVALSSPNDPELRAFINQTGVAWIPKPFQVGDLVELARKLLERPRAVASHSSAG